MATLIALLILVAVAIFLIGRRPRPQIEADAGVRAEFGIPLTEEEVDLERQYNEEIMQLLETRICASGFFKAEKIPDLMARLRGASVPFGRTNTGVAFDGNIILAVEEKKALGLNPRMKYSKTFVEYFDPLAFKTIEPKATLECMHLDAFHRVSRKKELLSLKKLGFVKQIKIVPVGDSRDCAKIKRFKKIHHLQESPELPLPGCDAPYCRCVYIAIIPKDV